MENPLADILANQITQPKHSLTFEERCGYHAALMNNVKATTVAKASGLSMAGVYRLKNAGGERADHYQQVFREWRRLSNDDYVAKYVTPVIRERLRVAQAELAAARLAPKPWDGCNPRADKYEGRWQNIEDRDGVVNQVDIFFSRLPETPGWRWRTIEDLTPRGDPCHEERGFATSGDAWRFCKLRFAPTADQIADGSWEAANDDHWLYEHQRPPINQIEVD